MIDQIRRLLLCHLFHPLQGMTFTTWFRLLQQNHFQIDLPYWPRAALLTVTSLFNACCRPVEDALYGNMVRGSRVEAPLFILGHYRSGTTHLHNLLTLDPQFASPNFFQAYFPHTFLLTECVVAPVAGLLLSRHRLQDNLARSVKTPAEDENALCAATLLSPYLREAFRKVDRDYELYLSFQSVSRQEIEDWKRCFVYYAQKLSYKYNKRLLFKSPAHTARVALLLDLFPDARFVHIYRHPYAVFQSTVHMMDAVAPVWHLQRPATRDNTEFIIRQYKNCMSTYMNARSIIPSGRLHEVRFENLISDPIEELRMLYSGLGLEGFSGNFCVFRDYLEAAAGHRLAVYPALPDPLRRRLSQEWSRYFHEWGYAR